ncbi:MAG TPA: hypothetical protein VL326_16510 [Kofleriaceae bacterium]|nr:hypothetical protein [Kofleriaceae bacterium]
MTLLLLATSVASAGPSKTPVPAKAPAPVKDDVKPIDLGPVADKLAAYKDEVGNIYVVPQTAKFDDTSEPQKWFFYGDGKTMYQQRVNRFTTGKGGIDASLLAPRAKDMVSGGYMVINNDEKYIACRPARVQGGRRELTALTADETAAVLKGKFLPPMPMRLPHFLGRDDDANYYYVDQLPSEAGGKGFRVYVGQTGAMKQLALTNMATDSAGEIYATKTGKLKLSAGKDLTAVWVKGGKRVELTIVPPADNRYLVFRELGIYGSLGTVCDDQ